MANFPILAANISNVDGTDFLPGSVEFDSSKPTGKRAIVLTVNGEALDEAKTYVLATNDFLVSGGDGYTRK